MLCISEFICENLLPVVSDIPHQPVMTYDQHIDVGVAKFNSPQTALMNVLKTNLEGEIIKSDDYKTAEERNDNGGTPKEFTNLPQFKL